MQGYSNAQNNWKMAKQGIPIKGKGKFVRMEVMLAVIS